MTERLNIALAQINPTVGNIRANSEQLRSARYQAAVMGADLMVATELAVTGYPPEDLVLRPGFQEAIEAEVQKLSEETSDGGPAMLIGTPWRENGKLYNAVALLDKGNISAIRFKYDLPNYSVFDEKRVFSQGPLPGPISFKDARLGALICEDMWENEVTECLRDTGAEILIVVNSSPFDTTKRDVRLSHAIARVVETELPLIYVNQIGGQDELVFEGGSFVLNANRSIACQLPDWQETTASTKWHRNTSGSWICESQPLSPASSQIESMYWAMVIGLRDYVEKNSFPSIILGLSGGIDSALSAAVAVDALGPDRVHTVMLPSRFTSETSVEDALLTSTTLGTNHSEVAIAPAVDAFTKMLATEFGNHPPGTAEENVQARIRALALMALSNKFGHMLLTTGNKSEMSVGYATLYGDMCGGYSVLKDIYKTSVYELAAWRNEHHSDRFKGPLGRVIPQRVLDKPPSAELRPDQTDQDTLPPYEVLDKILAELVETDASISSVVAKGFERDTVEKISNLLYAAEYKRRQSPPGVKITSKAFGRDRRYPITNTFQEK
tara:strand:- start:124 stop:1785 length:1662 start_codon:yes stop_codon:yes gene_type:complete